VGQLPNYLAEQQAICKRFGANFAPPPPGTKLGFAIESAGRRPVYGIRHLPVGDSNGWYIWCGEKSDDPGFFQALHTEHLDARCPVAMKFLALPPGYGFITDGDHVDVWFDRNFLVR
jgi:hypothetical protein